MRRATATLAVICTLQLAAEGAQERIGALGPSFGHAIALGPQTLVVGGPRHSQGRGGFWVYRRSEAGTWDLEFQVDGSPGDSLGHSVALDGVQLLVGAPGAGKACVYLREPPGWREQACLHAFGVRFGAAVALRNIFAIVGGPEFDQGRGRVDIFINAGQDVWAHHETLPGEHQHDAFGSAVAVNLEMMLVGAPGADGRRGQNSGLVYAYHRTGGSDWVYQADLEAGFDGDTGHRLGNAVAIEEVREYTRAIIGAAGGKRTFLFVHSRDLWSKADVFTPIPQAPAQATGTSVALSDDIAIIGSPSATPGIPGAAWIMQIDTTQIWQLRNHLENQSTFGTSVAASADQFAVATPGQDIYIYSRSHVLSLPPAADRPMFDGYPNPFEDRLTLTLGGGAPSISHISIFDATGRQVAVLDARGHTSLSWTPAHLAPGLYTAIAWQGMNMDVRHFVRVAK